SARLTGASLRVVGRGSEVVEDELRRAGIELVGQLDTAGVAKEMSGADVLLFPSFFEGFGRVILEGMAAGLPVVVSDWDGYKDTVRHGIDGYRIPTWMPSSGLGADLSLRHALEIDTYDMYCGHSASLVAVDIEAATQAFVELFQSTECRRQAAAQSADQIPRLWPARMDPFASFAAYPTRQIQASTTVSFRDTSFAYRQWPSLRALAMVNYAKHIMPDEKELEAIFVRLEQAPQKSLLAEVLLADFSSARRPYVLRALLWLAKLGVIRLGPISRREE
ncbi:MAG: glycosyltransferase, partial [Betaproteobacteria bacterium]|nr:glycosyltransferase [Betaproteobacteria bacterium]